MLTKVYCDFRGWLLIWYKKITENGGFKKRIRMSKDFGRNQLIRQFSLIREVMKHISYIKKKIFLL